MKKVDLHMHTSASDGRWTPEELLRQIKRETIDIFSITDHDNINSSEKMKKMVDEDLIFIPGVEVACTYKGVEYHLTTYHYKVDDKPFIDLLEKNMAYRLDYDHRVIKALSKSYDQVNFEEYLDYDYDRTRGGWKGLNYLIDKGLCSEIRSFFKLVGQFNFTMTFDEPEAVLNIIRESGAIPFLAHPSAYYKGRKLTYEELDQWKSFGIQGIECYTPYNGEGDSEYYKDYCNKNNLMISGGSDCHGGFVGRALGVPNIKLEDVSIEKLLNYKCD